MDLFLSNASFTMSVCSCHSLPQKASRAFYCRKPFPDSQVSSHRFSSPVLCHSFFLFQLSVNFKKVLFYWSIDASQSDSVIHAAAAAAAKSLQSCPTLCDPIDGSSPGSPVPGILQARTLEWVAISFSNAWKGKVKVKSLSHVRLLATPWTAAHQAPLSMGFSRQAYWSGVPLPSPP